VATNFVLISVDDMRTPDNWGHFTPLVSTPNMDRLADMGTTFERAVSQVPLCNPSRSSVLSGQQPTRTGVLDNQMPWFERIAPADTLPAVLKAAGVYVAMFGKNFHNEAAIDAEQQGVMFDEFLSGFPSSGSRAQVIEDSVQHDTPFASGRYRGTDLPDEATVDAAVEFLRDTAGDLNDPFFLGVGISKPHLNWWVPSRFYDLYDPAEIRAALRQSLQDGTIIPGNGEYFDVPPMSVPSPSHAQIAADFDLWADYIHAYLASVSYADAKVGEVLDAVAADPQLAADTAILLWSDHGYHLGDKDRWGKFTHWRESTEVPFILADPDQPGGQTARQIVSLVDIFPTILDSMGIAVPSRLDLDGESLLPIVRDVDLGWYNPGTGRGIAMTTIDGSVSIRAQIPGGRDVRYTRYPDGTEELYDITRDPDEHVNRVNFDTGRGLTPADDALRATMSALMDDELERSGYLVSDGERRLVGTAADEILVSTTGPGRNELSGGSGGDTYILYRDTTIIEAAGGGSDLVVFRNEALESSFALPANVEMAQVTGDFTGNASANRLIGGAGGNVLNGAGGNDTLLGLGGSDTLLGGSGNDVLRGSFAGDRLTGGSGRDTLDGGASGDTFAFAAPGDSTPTAPDTIVAFNGAGSASGDRIDLAAIDANAQAAGNQAFVFGGTSAGRVRTVANGGNTEVLANTDADPAMELRIVITDGSVGPGSYSASDFTL
jgi:arylsulfatase A-like enzyme